MTKSAGTAVGRRAPAEVGVCAAVRPATSRAKAIDMRSREYVEIRNMFFPPETSRFATRVVCNSGTLSAGRGHTHAFSPTRLPSNADFEFSAESETGTRRCLQHVHRSNGDLGPANVTVLNEYVSSGKRGSVLKHCN